MKKRPSGKFHKQLKPWRIERAASGWIKIVCPSCKNPTYVRRGRWLHSEVNRRYIGRCCPYCYRTGRIPSDDE